MPIRVRPSRLAVALVLAGLGPVAAPVAAATNAPAFAPHRAIYEMRLADEGRAAEIGGASGRLVYEFSGSRCEGWATRFRMVTRLEPQEGAARLTDLRTTTFEDGDGARFDFLNENWVDGRKVQEAKGRASRDAAGVRVRLERPAPAEATLTGPIFFPTTHMEAIAAAAAAGERVKEIDLFDGSETGVKPYRTAVVIGDEATGPDTVEAGEPGAASDLLKGHRRWPVEISFYDLSKATQGEATPDYQLSFLLYDNGVSRRLRFDYGSFVLRGDLSVLEAIPSDPCR